MTKSETGIDRRNIYQRLHAVMGEVDYIQKEPKKAGLQYSYVSHDAVTREVRPSLLNHGVVSYIHKVEPRQDGNRTSAYIEFRFVNIDDPTDFIACESFGYGVDSQDKGPGKAISYAVKLALLKTLSLETGDEPEEVQDERANHVSTRLGPTDIPKEQGDPSAAKSKKAWGILFDAMKHQKSTAELNRWWAASEKEIRGMNAQFRWDFFKETIYHGLKLAQKKLEIDLFWSFHEDRFARLKEQDIVRYEELEEAMLNKVEKLEQLVEG